jgi:hypothetical protein
MPGSDEKLSALLEDLHQLSGHLHNRGERSLTLSKQFTANAERDAGNRDFDLNQAKMLDYQHDLLHEIGNLVDKLIKQYER